MLSYICMWSSRRYIGLFALNFFLFVCLCLCLYYVEWMITDMSIYIYLWVIFFCLAVNLKIKQNNKVERWTERAQQRLKKITLVIVFIIIILVWSSQSIDCFFYFLFCFVSKQPHFIIHVAVVFFVLCKFWSIIIIDWSSSSRDEKSDL